MPSRKSICGSGVASCFNTSLIFCKQKMMWRIKLGEKKTATSCLDEERENFPSLCAETRVEKTYRLVWVQL